MSRAALALVALLLVASTGAASTAPYSFPANAGVDSPASPDPALQASPIDFSNPVPSATTFRVDARDMVGPTWIRVCIMLGDTCVTHGAANDTVTLDAVPGTGWPTTAVARVWVWTARVHASGDLSLGTWGGLRAQFGPGAPTDDIVPYLADGRAGLPQLVVEPSSCDAGPTGAVCVALPKLVKALRVSLHDDVASRVTFQACLRNGPLVLRCVNAVDSATIHGSYAVGTTLDIRVYAVYGLTPSGSKGYAEVRYFS